MRRTLATAAVLAVLGGACGGTGPEDATDLAASGTQTPPPTTLASPTPKATPLTAESTIEHTGAPTTPPHTPEPREGGPPTATLASGAGEVSGELGTHCWRYRDGAGLCADTIFLDPDDSLRVRRGETLTLSFDRPDDPDRLDLSLHTEPEGGHGTEIAIEDVNPAEFRVDEPEGRYWLQVFSVWDEGDATYFFEVVVL